VELNPVRFRLKAVLNCADSDNANAIENELLVCWSNLLGVDVCSWREKLAVGSD